MITGVQIDRLELEIRYRKLYEGKNEYHDVCIICPDFTDHALMISEECKLKYVETRQEFEDALKAAYIVYFKKLAKLKAYDAHTLEKTLVKETI